MFTETEKQLLRKLATDAVTHAVRTGKVLAVAVASFPEALRVKSASFVTLRKLDDELRGCIGHLEAFQPLVKDIADNACAAALHDPRFAPVSVDELSDLKIEISVLSAAEPLPCTSEADLLSKIRPGIDGLILTDGKHRSTFLPAVWEDLSDPRDFLRQLKLKAGLPKDHWSATLRVERYTADKL